MTVPSPLSKTLLAAGGGVAAAVGSALCCAGPLVAVFLGLSGAGLAATFEPLRPYFLGGTAALLGLGFYVLHREEKNACEPGKACADPRVPTDAHGVVGRDRGGARVRSVPLVVKVRSLVRRFL